MVQANSSAAMPLLLLATILATGVDAFSSPNTRFQKSAIRRFTVLDQQRGDASRDGDITETPHADDRRRGILRSSSATAWALASLSWSGVAPIVPRASIASAADDSAAPALLQTEAPPALLQTEAAPALLQTEAAPALLQTEAAPALLQTEVEIKRFVDSAQPPLFAIEVPKRFFALRRSAKGDLPDAKTGKGRRGGTIFTAGDMAKAEVIAVERFPTSVLLEEEGYDATGDLSSFKSIGEAQAVANLILRRREKDRPGTQNVALLNRDSVNLSPDGSTLTFSARQQINVQKPELLMEEIGLTELFRTTVAKATLDSKDGQMMVVFASAMDQDYAGPDGVALQKAVKSFVAMDQSGKK